MCVINSQCFATNFSLKSIYFLAALHFFVCSISIRFHIPPAWGISFHVSCTAGLLARNSLGLCWEKYLFLKDIFTRHRNLVDNYCVFQHFKHAVSLSSILFNIWWEVWWISYLCLPPCNNSPSPPQAIFKMFLFVFRGLTTMCLSVWSWLLLLVLLYFVIDPA